MSDLGILAQPYITSVDIQFMVAAGWKSKDLENFPADVIRSLIQFELTREETIEKFRRVLELQKSGSFEVALAIYEKATAENDCPE